MKAALHIGLLTSDLRHTHGWGSYSLSLVEALRDAGARLTILASRNSPPVSGVDILPILPPLAPRERGTLLRLGTRLTWARSALRHCDVIHATVEPFAPLAAAVAGARPLLVTGHGSYVRVDQAWRFPVNRVYAWAYRRALLVCVSRYTARAAEEALPGIRTTVVNNGVDAARFANLPALEPPKHAPTVLCVGAVKARKGTLELVRAIDRVRQTIPSVQCMILGSLTTEPAYVERVRAEIARRGLEDVVHLPGYVPESALLAWYGAADVFALPSMNAGWKFEGYGLSLIEASAAGLPVIGTTDCGAEDAVDHGVTGLLVSQQAVDAALPNALTRLLTDRTLAAAMGAAGRAKARRQTWARVAEQMIALYASEVRR